MEVGRISKWNFIYVGVQIKSRPNTSCQQGPWRDGVSVSVINRW